LGKARCGREEQEPQCAKAEAYSLLRLHNMEQEEGEEEEEEAFE